MMIATEITRQIEAVNQLILQATTGIQNASNREEAQVALGALQVLQAEQTRLWTEYNNMMGH